MKDCKHDYREVVITTQEWEKNYKKDSQYDYQVLNQQHLEIYCNKCGDMRNNRLYITSDSNVPKTTP